MNKHQLAVLDEIEACKTIVPSLLQATMKIPEVAFPETLEYTTLANASMEKQKQLESKYAAAI